MIWRNRAISVLDSYQNNPTDVIGVNDSGEVVGSSLGQPLFWDTKGNVTRIKLGTANRGNASSINPHGFVAGTLSTGGAPVGVVWSRGEVTVLPTDGATGRTVRRVSDSGLVSAAPWR